jgi:biopolymer transport protein ExbD
MRLITKASAKENPDVPLTPLIDCVFLLIVFFLVTSMFKRWEMIIPVRLPDATSSLSAQAEEAVVIIGIDREGKLSMGQRIVQDNEPTVTYSQVESLPALLAEIARTRGSEAELVIAAHRDLPMQSLIKTVDEIKLTGFSNVTVQTNERRR